MSLDGTVTAQVSIQANVTAKKMMAHYECNAFPAPCPEMCATTRLNAEVADALCDIRRMGPNVRCYLVTEKMEREDDLPYIAQMQNHLVEVCYVTPA